MYRYTSILRRIVDIGTPQPQTFQIYNILMHYYTHAAAGLCDRGRCALMAVIGTWAWLK